MKESVDVRLARIEECQNQIRKDLTAYHKAITEKIEPKLEANHDEITRVKRDRVWLVAIGGLIGTWLGKKFIGGQ